MTATIETEGLTKLYGAERGIEDVTMAVELGEVFGFLGLNGAGKTTTIHTLLDLLHPSSGSSHLLLGLPIGLWSAFVVAIYPSVEDALASVFRYYGTAIEDGIDPLSFLGVTAVAVALAAPSSSAATSRPEMFLL